MGVSKNPVKIGDKFQTRHFGEVSVVAMEGHAKITVVFADGSIKVSAGKEVRNGSIRNDCAPSVYGVGFIGEGSFLSTIGNANTPEYEAWRGVIRRCYDPASLVKHPSYTGCTVCPEWHNFQVFAEWYTKQPGYAERLALDKDLTILGSRIYSPETCSLIPMAVNSLLTGGGKRVRGDFPIGVHWCNTKLTFVAQIHSGGKAQKFLGYHACPKAAFSAYKVAKESHVKEVAAKYKHEISETIYNNLMTYSVSITD